MTGLFFSSITSITGEKHGSVVFSCSLETKKLGKQSRMDTVGSSVA